MKRWALVCFCLLVILFFLAGTVLSDVVPGYGLVVARDDLLYGQSLADTVFDDLNRLGYGGNVEIVGNGFSKSYLHNNLGSNQVFFANTHGGCCPGWFGDNFYNPNRPVSEQPDKVITASELESWNMNPFQLVVLHSCRSAEDMSLANGFGITESSIDRGFVGWHGVATDSINYATFINLLFANLTTCYAGPPYPLSLGESIAVAEDLTGITNWRIYGDSNFRFACHEPGPPASPTPPPPSPTPPPPQEGVEVLSIYPSGQTFQPNEEFTPRVRIRVTGFTLSEARGDHLNNLDGNTYDTWPVQPVKGEGLTEYEFVYSPNMKAPGAQGSYTSKWKLRVGGNYKGPDIVVAFNVGQEPPPPPPPGNWHVEYFSDKSFGGRCYDGYESGTFMFKDWGENPPAGGCPADNWSARFSSRVHFHSGSYTFGLGSDDWARIKLGSDTVVDNWEGRGQHYEGRTLSDGDYDVIVEFADTLGHAKLVAWWWGPGFDVPREEKNANQWYAEYWANQDHWWDPIVKRNESGEFLYHEWEGNGPGWGLPDDHFSTRFEKTVNFACGRYRFHVFQDDGARVYFDGNLVPGLDHWQDGRSNYYAEVDLTGGDHTLRVDHYENGGWAAISLDWQLIQPCPSPTATPTPTPSPTSGFCDDFDNSSLDPRWQWVDELEDSSYSLTARPGYLRLYTPDGGHNLAGIHTAPRIIQSISGDFIAWTKVSINPSPQEYRAGGLLIWQDTSNYIRLERLGTGNIRFIRTIAGVYTDSGNIPFSSGPTHLRLERTGNTVSTSYSADGSVWTSLPAITFSGSSTLVVGLYIINDYQDNPLWADFDYFYLGSCAPTPTPTATSTPTPTNTPTPTHTPTPTFTPTPSSTPPVMAWQSGTVRANHRWKKVTFPKPFSVVPNLQATTNTEKGGQSAHVDIRRLTKTGFQVRVEEDSGLDGKHVFERIAWLALAKAPPGGQIGTVRANHRWKKVTFPKPFSVVPNLQATINTEKGRQAAHVDIRRLTKTGFEVRVEEDSKFDGKHVFERIAWLALA